MNASKISTRFRLAPATVVICGTILVAPELFGGAFPWAVVAIAGLSVVSLGTALWVQRKASMPVLDGILLAMGVAWVWTCLQALPLPSGIAHALGLRSAQIAERFQGLVWADSVPFTISHDPGSTHIQILIGVGILASFLAARLGGRRGLKPIAIATVASAVLIGLVGFAHQATGAEVLFGVYAPRFTATRLLAPLMNGNHLAGFSLVGALIAAGRAVQEGRQQRRIAWIVASVFCTIVVAWTLSRGGIAALLFGFVSLAAWLIGGSRSNGRSAAIPIAVVGAAVAGIVAFASLEPILRRFETQGLDKLALAAQGLRLLDGPTWWLGVGRGAFSAAFVAQEGSRERFTHPENFIVQWTTEWGAPVAAALLLVLMLALWKRFREAEDPLIAAVSIAISALVLQNLVDFSLEMAGVVVVVAALLGALLPAQDTSRPQRARGLLLASFGAFVVALVALGPGVLGSDTQSLVDRLTRAMRVNEGAEFEATLRRGLGLHPSEPAFALLAGSYAGSTRHPDTARWLSIAMEQAPGWGAPHEVAARWLFAEGRTDQALLEIREAEQRYAGQGHPVLCEILARYPRMDYIDRAAPTEDRRIAYLNRTNSYCPGLPPELRAEIDRKILQDEPTHAWASLRESQRLIAKNRSSDAIALLERAIEHHPDNDRLRLALVNAHVKAGSPEQARLVLQRWMEDGIATQALLEAQARVEAALGQADEMRAILTRLRGQARGEPHWVAASFILEGQLEASLGHIDKALAAYAAADAADPESPALQHAATLALSSGRPTQARRTYRILCRRKPDGPACTHEARLSKELTRAPPEEPMP